MEIERSAARNRHRRTWAERVQRACLQRTRVDVRRSAVGVGACERGGAREHIDSTVAADRGRKHIVRGRVIEVDRTDASAKCDARRIERAGCRARADVECSNRTGVVRDHNSRRGNDAALRNRERAGARVANVKPRYVAPKGARAGHRRGTVRACTLAYVGDEGGAIDDAPAVCDRECAGAKTADIEPGGWTVDPAGARAGHGHRARRAGGQSDGAAATTVQRTAVFDGNRPRAQGADLDGSGVGPRGACAGYGHRALRARQIANKSAEIAQRPAVLDCERSNRL
jgi:hypothetical protein